jgi:hypothetical protein
MTVSNDTPRTRICGLVTLVLFGMASLAGAQATSMPATGDAGHAITLGILPFTDATASGNRTVGADVGRTMLSEVVNSTNLQPRMLASDRADELDAEKALALGREHHLDLVFMGTVLDARTETSNKSGWLPSIKGQSGNISVHRVKATVTLQGELYDVANGRRIFSVRVTGNDSNNKVSGTAYTNFGSWGNDGYLNFLDSPLGKALQTAIADMTKKVAAARSDTRD